MHYSVGNDVILHPHRSQLPEYSILYNKNICTAFLSSGYYFV